MQEQQLLRQLNFNLEVHTPHIFLLHYSKTFSFSSAAVRVAYALLSDSLSSSACLAFPAHVLAAAALAAAARMLGDGGAAPSAVTILPANRKWYSLCDVTDRQIAEASALLVAPFSDIPKE